MKFIQKISRYTFRNVNISKDLTPSEFVKLASKHPSKIKRSKFIVPHKFGAGFKAKVRVVFE